MSKKLLPTYLFFLILALTACKKVINIKVDDASSLFVIEGNITNVTGAQTVTISKSIPYDSVNVYPPVSKANVVLSNGFANYIMKENKPGQYILSNSKGRPGQTYTLKVTIADVTYTASSVMPEPVQLDSLSINALSFGSKTVKTVSVYYRDPPGLQNQYRFIMYVNGIQVKKAFAADDKLTNGRLVNTTLYQDDIEVNAGDKIEVEMQCVDKDVFNYWFSLSQQGGNGPSNSATPSNPTSNISNGALGYFSAHTVQRKSITVQ